MSDKSYNEMTPKDLAEHLMKVNPWMATANKDLLGLPDAPTIRREMSKKKGIKAPASTDAPIPLSAYRAPRNPLAVAAEIINAPIVITFDSLPPSALYPNVTMSQHWRVRQVAAKKARQDGEDAGLDFMANTGKPWMIVEKYSITIQCTVPDRHLRDLLGAAGACKAWIDGLVSSGLIADDNDKNLIEARVLAPIYSKGVSKTEIRIREVL